MDGIEDMPINRQLKQLCDQYRKRAKKGAASVLCMNCKKAPAVDDCETCHVSLCKDCWRVVHAPAVFQKHTAAQLGTIAAQEKAQKVKRCTGVCAAV